LKRNKSPYAWTLLVVTEIDKRAQAVSDSGVRTIDKTSLARHDLDEQLTDAVRDVVLERTGDAQLTASV
jgi:hypothetical protein